MRIIISPAKKMITDTDSIGWLNLPQFLPEAEAIKRRLQLMSPPELKNLWRCNDSIASLNINRLSSMDLTKNLSPAILSYQGLQYQYMAPAVFEYGHLEYVCEHLRVLSGFYGLLRPLDGVVPHRLEMQAKLSMGAHKDLYRFWGNKVAKQLCAETDLILNLASQEYSQIVSRHLESHVSFIKCTFCHRVRGKFLQKGTLCKMARGRMVRYLAENNIESPKGIMSFDELGYSFSAQHSTNDNLVFVREKR